jgi:hypothetical protein
MRNGQVSKDNGDGTITISGNCFVTKKRYSVTVPKEGFARWQAGSYIQNAMPRVSPEDREFLISGTSPEGWNAMFPEESVQE